MPESLPGIAPWEPSKPARPGYLRPVPDGPLAVSLTAPAGVSGTAAKTAEMAQAEVPADVAGDAEPDTPAVTDTPDGTVTDVSVTAVSDGDTDTDAALPAIAEFGREISPVTLAGIKLAQGAGIIGWHAAKGIARTGTWTKPPESVAGHPAWINDRTWIPDELQHPEEENVKDEGLIRFLVFLRKAWGWTVGMALTAAGNALVWLRLPQHFALALAAAILLYIFAIR